MQFYSILKKALIKALLACVLFVISYLFYDTELIRANVEDIAFDIVNQLSIKNKPQNTQSPHVLLFSFDDAYMQSEALLDKHNQNQYGYLFPRDKIAAFITQLDQFVAEIESVNYPKALFIDYDLSFSSMPYGKALSEQDQQFIDVLKKPRPYSLLLAKTADSNFIETSQDAQIQAAIAQQTIQFVSAPLLLSNDNVIRRYQSLKAYNQPPKEYLGAGVALWSILKNKPKQSGDFLKKDTIANRIWLKAYQSTVKEDGCRIDQSYWQKLTKYSVNCSLFEVVEEDFANSVLLLGGTHSQNGDRYNVNPVSFLNVVNTEQFSGVDIHANALMTMLHLNGSMHRLALWKSLLLIFFSFLLLALITAIIFHVFRFSSKSGEFIVMLSINAVVLISLSIYLLREHQLWFNWFIPFILIELIEIVKFTKKIFAKIPVPNRKKHV